MVCKKSPIYFILFCDKISVPAIFSNHRKRYLCFYNPSPPFLNTTKLGDFTVRLGESDQCCPKSNSTHFRRPTVKQMLQLPAVQKEVKRRQRQLAREEMWSGLVALFTPIIFLAVWAWNNLCLLPVAALRRFWVDTDNKTPPNSIHQPNDDSFKVTNSLRMLASRFQLTIR